MRDIPAHPYGVEPDGNAYMRSDDGWPLRRRNGLGFFGSLSDAKVSSRGPQKHCIHCIFRSWMRWVFGTRSRWPQDAVARRYSALFAGWRSSGKAAAFAAQVKKARH